MDSEILYEISDSGVPASAFIVTAIIAIIILIASIKLFKKAGKPGWMAIIPILSAYKMQQIIFGDDKGWTMLLYFVPILNVAYAMYSKIKLCHAYGKSTGFGVFSIFFNVISTLILAFGSCEYQGPQEHILLAGKAEEY